MAAKDGAHECVEGVRSAGGKLSLILGDGRAIPVGRIYANGARKQFDRAFNEKTRLSP